MIANEDKKIRKLGEQQSEATTLLANILCDRTIAQWQSFFKRNLQTQEKDLTRELRNNIDTCALGRIPDNCNVETLGTAIGYGHRRVDQALYTKIKMNPTIFFHNEDRTNFKAIPLSECRKAYGAITCSSNTCSSNT